MHYEMVDSDQYDSHKLTFDFRFTKYFFDADENCFLPIVFDVEKSYDQIHRLYANGISFPEEYDSYIKKFGKCDIELPKKGIIIILIQEILNPFYLFQFFSLIYWYFDYYQVYATCILITSIVSITTELIDIKRNLNKLQKMAHYECDVTVHRLDYDNKVVRFKIPSTGLVPGDIFEVPEQCKLPCDAILLAGSCIINEAMLTGESIPVIKTPLPEDPHQIYHPDNWKAHTLYSGTDVIINKKLGGKDPKALVTKTGFDTLKGSLIKSILFPKPNRFSFYADSMKFIGVLAILSIIGFVISLPAAWK